MDFQLLFVGLAWHGPNQIYFNLLPVSARVQQFYVTEMHHDHRGQGWRDCYPLSPPSLYCAFLHSLARACSPRWASFRLSGRSDDGRLMFDRCNGVILWSLDLVRYSILLGRVGWIRSNLTWDLSWDWLVWIPTSCSRGGWDLNEIHYLRFWDSPNRMFKWAIIATPIHFVYF
jgi:hypothetical protein